jgi:hypothetical protein
MTQNQDFNVPVGAEPAVELNGKVYVADEIDEILPLINEDFLRKAYTGEISLHMGYVL